MKRLLLSTTALLIINILSGQDITGRWNGILNAGSVQLRLVFDISKTENGYSTTMDSPDQGAKGIPITSTVFENPKLKLEIPAARIEYNGELKESSITGTFKQNGQEFPLTLTREQVEKPVTKRPQEPIPPYPYYSEDVTFDNEKANITLAGTLTLPKQTGTYPAVILITGSGPQNRNEELLRHKPFLVIADHLTRNGIAVLRYDDRGFAGSKGDFASATSADFATDVEAAVAYLKTRKEIDHKKIGLVGHSEGGMIAPMVASGSKDVSFIVLLAGPGIRGDKLLLLQQELIARASGASETDIQKTKEINSAVFEMTIGSTNNDTLKRDLKNYLEEYLSKDSSVKPKGMTDAEYISSSSNQLTNPWIQFFLKYDPAVTLEKVKCPVLAVNGSKDLQVPPKENLEGISNALKKGKNKKLTVIEFPGLNHLFQECTTGAPGEYARIEQTFSPAALDKITSWIIDQVK